MNIKQLNKLIQEELKAYLREEEEEMDMDMGDEEGDDIEVTTDEEPEGEGEDAMETLRQIYDMLTPIVGGEEEEMDMEDMEGEEEEGEEEGEEEEEEIDEAVDNHTFFRGDNVGRIRVDAKDVQGRREKVNESMLRMQKLAGLITESDIKKKLNLKENDRAQLNALAGALQGEHAKDVIASGRFTKVDTFGSGDDVSPLVNVMDELKSELRYFKTPEDKDSDDFEDLMMDLEAAKEIAKVVASMGGRVSYGGDSGLEFVYSVNNKGDLLGQAVAV